VSREAETHFSCHRWQSAMDCRRTQRDRAPGPCSRAFSLPCRNAPHAGGGFCNSASSHAATRRHSTGSAHRLAPSTNAYSRVFRSRPTSRPPVQPKLGHRAPHHACSGDCADRRPSAFDNNKAHSCGGDFRGAPPCRRRKAAARGRQALAAARTFPPINAADNLARLCLRGAS
jgi:hypothetical protein